MPSNTLQNYEQLSYGAPGLSMHRGQARQVISDAVATRTLLAKESGALCCMDSAAGVVYTLPPASAAMIGATFEFITTVTVTSNAAKVITADAATFLLGEVLMGSTATASPGGFAANGSTIRALSSNGSTTGGIIGDRYRVTCISATQWFVEGVLIGSGTLATPFATS